MRIDRSRSRIGIDHRYRNKEKILILSHFRNLEIPTSSSMYSRLSSRIRDSRENVTIRSALRLQGDPSYRYRLHYSCRFVLSTQSFSPRSFSSSPALISLDIATGCATAARIFIRFILRSAKMRRNSVRSRCRSIRKFIYPG